MCVCLVCIRIGVISTCVCVCRRGSARQGEMENGGLFQNICIVYALKGPFPIANIYRRQFQISVSDGNSVSAVWLRVFHKFINRVE